MKMIVYLNNINIQVFNSINNWLDLEFVFIY